MASKPTIGNDDAALLAHIGRDPYGGLAEVLDRHGGALLGRLHAYAEACGYGAVDVEDVFEKTINSLLDPRKRAQLVDAGGQILPWLTRLGYWRLMDAKRRRQRFQLPLDENMQQPADSPTAEKISPAVDDIKRALELLSPRAREVLQMRYGERLTNEQVGQRLGITPGAAKKAAHDARERLKWLLIEGGFHIDEGGSTDV